MLLRFSDWLVYDLLNLSEGSGVARVFHFFVYDSMKIFLLLFGLIFFIGVVRTYLPQERIKTWMNQKGGAGKGPLGIEYAAFGLVWKKFGR